MSGINLLPEEREISFMEGKYFKRPTRLVLTNRRVYQETTVSGNTDINIIPLSKIDSFGVGKAEHTWLLILGVITLIFYGLGLIFLLIWYFTRRTTLRISSGKTDIMVEVSPSSRDSAMNFVNQVQIAFSAEPQIGDE